MAEKGLDRKDLEDIFTGFEKRQDGKFQSLEGRMDEKLQSLEGRMDGKFQTLEERMDEKLQSLEGRMDGKFQSLEGRVDLKLKDLEGRVVNQFHIISEGLMDHIKLLAEGHVGIVERLDRMEKENERQHLETRSLIKLSFSELDRRLTDLESQMKELQEWRRQVESRLQI